MEVSESRMERVDGGCFLGKEGAEIMTFCEWIEIVSIEHL